MGRGSNLAGGPWQFAYLLERDQDHDGVRRRVGEAARRLETVHARHSDLDENHVGPELGGQREGLSARCRLPDLEEARRRRNQLAHGAAEDLMVIDGEDRDRPCTHAHTLRRRGFWRKGTPHPPQVVRARALADTGPMTRGAVSHDAANTEPKISVVLADDSYLVREAVGHVLAEADGVEVIATCEDKESLMKAIEETRPDVVVTDIRMPPTDSTDGLQVAATLRETHPEVGVVVLSQFAEPEYGLALLEGGSEGRAYLLKERVQHRGQLIAAIEAVAEGGSVIDAKVVETLVEARKRAESSPLGELTPRELEILTFVARGHSNQAIADELVLTKRAVEKHINAIFLKLNLTYATDVSRRVKAALIYLAEVDGN